MSLSKEEIIDAISSMSIMDITELVSSMEEKIWRIRRSYGSASRRCGRWCRSCC